MFFLDALAEVFPDAFIVHLVREPEAVFASSCSGMQCVRELYYAKKDTNNKMERKLILEQMHETAARLMKSLDCTKLPTAIVHYSDLVCDPLAAVGGIYKAFSLGETGQLPHDLVASIKRYIAENPQGLHGHHHYSIPDSLSATQVREELRNYCTKFFSSEAEQH